MALAWLGTSRYCGRALDLWSRGRGFDCGIWAPPPTVHCMECGHHYGLI